MRPLTAGELLELGPGSSWVVCQGSALILARARATCSSGRPGTDAPPTPSTHLHAGDPPGVPQHSRPLKPRSEDSWRPILDLWGPLGRDRARSTPQIALGSQASSAQASVRPLARPQLGLLPSGKRWRHGFPEGGPRTGPRASPALPGLCASSFHLPLALRVRGSGRAMPLLAAACGPWGRRPRAPRSHPAGVRRQL